MAHRHFRTTSQLPSDEDVFSWIDEIRDKISYAASIRGKRPRDFAATLIAVLSNGTDTLIVQIGDGCAVLKDVGATDWRIPLWPDHGEYASTTYFITDDPSVKCRILRESVNISVLAVLTDGLERLSLDLASEKPSSAFFDGMSKPLLATTSSGKNLALSKMLKEYLDGEAVCARTDDDKTLVIATKL
jgi:hypothetical protein